MEREEEGMTNLEERTIEITHSEQERESRLGVGWVRGRDLAFCATK